MRRAWLIPSCFLCMWCGDCGGGSQSSLKSTPIVQSFFASPTPITSGQSTTLYWSVLNATSISINNGVGSVTQDHSIAVTPSSTTTYTLTADNGRSSILATTTVEVINAKPHVIPSLRQWTGGSGLFTLTANSRVCVDPSYSNQLSDTANVFVDDLTAITGSALNVVNTSNIASGDLYLTLNSSDSDLGTEGYSFEVGSSLTIRANAVPGILFGTRTALQILKQDPAKANIPAGIARDYPKYQTREFMLDIGRMQFSSAILEDYLKFLSWYKMNEFHLHLNDNKINPTSFSDYSAFRLQSTTYPGLAAQDTSYSYNDLRAIQDLAKKYAITIIPEIDTPAHSLAFTNYRQDLAKLGNIDMLDLSLQGSFDFVDGLWNEFNPLFDSRVVHIGSDEYDTSQVTNYKKFIDHVDDTVKAKGKTARMWGSLSQFGGASGVNRDITIDVWEKNWYSAQNALNDGYQIINSELEDLYIVPLNYSVDSPSLYANWEPYVFTSGNVNESQVLGGQLCVWNDNLGRGYTPAIVYSLDKLGIQAVAEKMWSGSTSSANIPYATFNQYAAVIDDAPGTALGVGPFPAFSPIVAATYSNAYGTGTEACSDTDGGTDVGHIDSGDYLIFNNVDFGATPATGFQARAASNAAGGNIEVRLDNPSGTLLGTCAVPGTGGWQVWTTTSCNIRNTTGVHNICLNFTGGAGPLFNVHWFTFTQ